jgi:hypothetical protein
MQVFCMKCLLPPHLKPIRLLLREHPPGRQMRVGASHPLHVRHPPGLQNGTPHRVLYSFHLCKSGFESISFVYLNEGFWLAIRFLLNVMQLLQGSDPTTPALSRSAIRTASSLTSDSSRSMLVSVRFIPTCVGNTSPSLSH